MIFEVVLYLLPKSKFVNRYSLFKFQIFLVKLYVHDKLLVTLAVPGIYFESKP